MTLRRKQRSAASFAGVSACALLVVLAGGLSAPASAQAVVQAIPPAELGNLNGALRDLARNPNDVFALLRAGRASIGLNDLESALGYFRRAEALAPADGRVKAGLASALVRTDNAVAAVQLFAQAEASGTSMAEYAADRGLAHDLVGENARAQQLYRQALARVNDPEVVRRLALSQAIMGDQRGSETSLLPLLQRQDLAAYRTRAFALAILGKSEEAVSIAQTMLPPRLSNRMAPYLRYMPRLTRAQQAAAAHLGRFPRASEIGRDRAQIAAYAGTAAPPQVAARTSDSRLIPAGQPLGNARPPAPAASYQAQASVPAAPVQTVAAVPLPAPQPVVAAAVPQRVAAAVPQPVQAQPVLVASIAVSAPAAPAPTPAVEAPRPSLSIAAPAAETAEPEVSLSEAFAAFTLVPDAPPPAARGAVDITAIKPPREKPKVEEPNPPREKPKVEPPMPPAHPSRFWVQVATGRDLSALAFDWRRIKRTAGDLLAKREPFTADWGQTNRLVTGPYANAAEAQKAVSALKEKGVDSFPFTSAAGEELAPLK
jgi:Flp pilus assembly protein TadD